MLNLWLAIAHHLAFLGLASILAIEIALIRPGITAEQVVRIRRLDGIFGSLIGLILLIGILMVTGSPKGQDFYTANPVFWMKMAAFTAMALLSVMPTIRIYYWWQEARGGSFFSAPPEEIAKVRTFLKAEAAFFVTIPGFAAAAARGIGL
jgi:putative membrane protein